MLTLHFAPNSRASRTLWLLDAPALDYQLNLITRFLQLDH